MADRMIWAAYMAHRTEIAGLLDERFYPLDWLDQQVGLGAIHLLANDAAVCGYEIKSYPGGALELHGMFAAGDLAGVLDLIDQAIAIGRGQGCTVATISSRTGWGKVLRSRGFGPHQTTILKELG